MFAEYDDYDRSMFQDPGRSSLRKSSQRNPRNLPCPTCGEPNRLTPADQAAGTSATVVPTGSVD